MIAAYRLLEEHRHNRVLHAAGAELELPQQLGDWLVAQGKAERVGAPPAAPMLEAGAFVQRAAPPKRTTIFAPRAGRSCCGWSK